MKYILTLLLAVLVLTVAAPVYANDVMATATAGDASASASASAGTTSSEATTSHTASATADVSGSDTSTVSVFKHHPARIVHQTTTPVATSRTNEPSTSNMISLTGPIDEKVTPVITPDQPDQSKDLQNQIDRLKKSNKILAFSSLILILIIVGLIIGLFLALRD